VGGRRIKSQSATSASPARQRRLRAELAARLQERRAEIEGAARARVYAIADPVEAADPHYEDGLKEAVSEALAYGFEAIERGEEAAPQVPPTLLAQARLAARNKVNLDTVLRRYFAGYTLFGDFLVQEAEREEELDASALKQLLQAQGALFDRLIVAVTEEYGRERGSARPTAQERKARKIERLLAGEPLDASGLGYELGAHHLGIAAAGEGAEQAIRELAAAFDRRLLAIEREDGTLWAWLGGRLPVDPAQVRGGLSPERHPGAYIALGEPGEGLEGWQLSHHQALAALPIALRGPEPLVRYGEVALLAAVLQDELLATSLRRLYLEPLATGPEGGATLRETLRAYFEAERNVSSTAASLGVSRKTVVNRLQAIEERYGRPLNTCAAEVEATLALEKLGHSPLKYRL
jgi:PucR C-terminal helix-turn-helix domain/GGDEF-like domain